MRDLRLESSIIERLGKLPANLRDLYEEAFVLQRKQRHEAELLIADDAYRLLLCRQEPLKSRDFLEALTFCREWVRDLSSEVLLDLCFNFVVRDSELDVFRFAHLSVREFFEMKDAFSYKGSHTLGAIHCLKILTAEDVVKRKTPGKFDNASVPLGRGVFPRNDTPLWLSPFHEYAALYWAHHLYESGDYWKMDPLEALVTEFVLGNQQDGLCAFQRWATDIRLEHKYRHYASFDWTSQCSRRNVEASCEPVNPIFVASIWNLRDVLEMRVCAEPKSLNITTAGSQGAQLKAFEFACLHGNLEAAQYLLHKEADPDRSTESMRIPLVGAILCKNLDLVRLLLEHGADPNSRPDSHPSIHDLESSGGRFDPLSTDHASAATSLAHYESLRHADPIFEAVKTRCTPLVQVLLDFGAVPLRARPNIKDHLTSSWRSTRFEVERDFIHHFIHFATTKTPKFGVTL